MKTAIIVIGAVATVLFLVRCTLQVIIKYFALEELGPEMDARGATSVEQLLNVETNNPTHTLCAASNDRRQFPVHKGAST